MSLFLDGAPAPESAATNLDYVVRDEDEDKEDEENGEDREENVKDNNNKGDKYISKTRKKGFQEFSLVSSNFAVPGSQKP